MKRPPHDPRPLLEPWVPWHELPDAIRQRVLDVLTILYFETVDSSTLETDTDDSSKR